jgi:hypothetical protein
MLWTWCLCYNIHRFEEGWSIHSQRCGRIVLSFVCAVVFIRFCLHACFLSSHFGLFGEPSSSCVLLMLGIVGWWHTLFGSLYTPSWCSFWSWSELISFWVRLRKPQQNPILLGILDLRMEFWFVHGHTSKKHLVSHYACIMWRLRKFCARFKTTLSPAYGHCGPALPVNRAALSLTCFCSSAFGFM